MGLNAKLSLFFTCALTISAFTASSAQAAEEHLYDPALSLTGNTATNAEDEIPDPSGPNPEKPHPSKRFNYPCGTAADSHGDIYVASPDQNNNGIGTGGRIDVFNPKGEFLVEIPNEHGPCNLAVDSVGNVYVREVKSQVDLAGFATLQVDRYEPSSYPPTQDTEYSLAKELKFIESGPGMNQDLCAQINSVAVDPSNDHLYIGHGCRVEEYGSAAEGSALIRENAIDGGVNDGLRGSDVYGANHDVYVVQQPSKVYLFDGVDGHVKCELEGSETPAGAFAFPNNGSVAVDQSTGDLYVYDVGHKVIDQFGPAGEGCPKFIGRLPGPPPKLVPSDLPTSDLAVDSPCRKGPELSEPCRVGESYDSPNEGYVFVDSGETTNSHLFAFEPKLAAAPPEVREQSVGGVGETEAALEAEVNPNGFETAYHFQYTSQAGFEEHGYEGATSIPIPDADAAAGGAFVPVSEPISGLTPGTVYRFRLVASNCEAEEADPEHCLTLGEGKPGEEGEDASFATYPTPPASPPCENVPLRTGASAALPDCRAYELVTPPDTGGRVPTMSMLGQGNGVNPFDTTMASPDGESLVFGSKSGSLPGIGGGGNLDTYEARRGAAGWRSGFTGLGGAQAQLPGPGGISADHGYAFWTVNFDRGSLADPQTERAQYLRVPAGTKAGPNCSVEAEPEGRFEWVGCGSLGTDRLVRGKWISEGGGHVIFETRNDKVPALRLEECAPSTGLSTIYDRTPGGATHCVSLLPGDVTPAAGATYAGASADGSAVAFGVSTGDLYVRLDNTETVEVAAAGATFAGISEGGSRVFYLAGGDVFACDTAPGSCAGPEATHEPIPVGSGGESTLVNVSADGSHAYFVSKAVLGGEGNEWGQEALAGAQNLYAWDGEGVRFIATLDALDVSGKAGFGGLGLWVSEGLSSNPDVSRGPANDPSRTTPDGKVLVFESTAGLTGYDSAGRREVYRYDSRAEAGERLACLSCNPTGVPAVSDALLESRNPDLIQPVPPVNSLTRIANVTADGKKVFFQSSDRLVPADVDGKQDVYEWEAEGLGGCKRQAGCLALISSGKSAEDEFLYAMTPDGHDVFFLSGDILTARDPDGTPSIYDARVEGGFPLAAAREGDCLGEACQPVVAAPGEFSSVLEEGVAPPPGTHCPKGKRKVRKAGKARCVTKHRGNHKRHRGHKQADAKRRTPR